jgi:hypothetical protein
MGMLIIGKYWIPYSGLRKQQHSELAVNYSNAGEK